MPANTHNGAPYELSEVLLDEFKELRLGESFEDIAANSTGPEPDRRRTLYRKAHQLNLSALALSGGGIRSASLGLGVIQGLADKNLLKRFDYLSTVSGGGYIGSWLSAWLYHAQNADTVLAQLRSARADADDEPPSIDHLRDYSSYLTPKLGLLSADTWAAVAIVLRNMVLNWLILIPAIALPVVAVKLLAVVAHGAPSVRGSWTAALVAAICLVLGSMSLGYKLLRLYSPDKLKNAQTAQQRFLMWSLAPAVVAGALFTWLANRQGTPGDALARAFHLGSASSPSWWAMVIFALMIYAAALGADYWKTSPLRIKRADIWAWAAAVVIFATIVWAGAAFYHTDAFAKSSLPSAAAEMLLVVFGIPWFLLATLLAQTTYLLLRSYSPMGDVEREWLGRASGWHFIAALVWITLSALVLFGPWLYYGSDKIAAGIKWLIPMIGTASGVVTALLGKSAATPAQGGSGDQRGFAANIAIAIAGPLFGAILLITLSFLFDQAVPGAQACFPLPGAQPAAEGCTPWSDWLLFGIGLTAIAFFAQFFVNVNRFSLHTLYRNRLIRAFLGGARVPDRQPDGFTGFDWHDNLRVASLWGSHPPEGSYWRPFHVINMTLNLTSPSKLAWQQRKGESFCVTPQFCGTADLGYRPTNDYGDPEGGISLGTAMAISGAAVSPNMGYHSSPSIAFLMTLFNVRLGWWLGNPGRAGNSLPPLEQSIRRQLTGRTRPLAPYTQDAPWFAVWPLLSELFGLTTENSRYVYLSDGGHFENLGLYEMVRRRCRWIIVSDGGQDLDRGYEDLGNAVRKISIDLGVRIRFPNSPLLLATKDSKPADLVYCALGTIDYSSDRDGEKPVPRGKILYIKPAVRGDEGAAEIIAYQRGHPDFPNQSTANQWFDEPQLEAYRSLGHYILTKLVDACGEPQPTNLEELFDRLEQLDLVTLKLR
jgi:Patatin-like phospholipase